MANLRKDKKGRGLHTGEQQRKDGIYLYRYTDITGKRRTVYAGDLPELRQKEKQIQKDLDDGIHTDAITKNMTLNELFEQYISVKMASKSTIKDYRNLWRWHVKEALGYYKITQVSTIHIKAFYAGLTKQGYRYYYIRNIHRLLSSVLGMAVENDIIRKNPANKAFDAKCGVEPKEKDILTISQQEQLFAFLENDATFRMYTPIITIILETGLRCGELVGLTWNDVSLEEKTVSIDHQLMYRNFGDGCKMYIAAPKTKSGIRMIPLTNKAVNAFKQQKELNKTLGRTCNKIVDGYTNFIFLTSKGTPYLPIAINSVLYEVSAAINKAEKKKAVSSDYVPEYLPKFSAHDLRHTFCTNKARQGMNLKSLQYVMGHSNSNTTFDIYNHMDNLEDVRYEMIKCEDVAYNNYSAAL